MMRAEVAVTEVDRTAAWDGATPIATVVVATCDRAPWLPGLIRSLEQQAISLELVLVDDASQAPASLPSTDLPVLLLRTHRRAGPSAARNAGAVRRRTGTLLLTDDDCLPDPGWAQAHLTALPGHGIVQGATSPVDDEHGPWDRSIAVGGLTGLWETCNLAVDGRAFDDAGGFAELGLLGSGSRGFGEDAELGARIARVAGGAFAPGATVRHRWIAGDYRDHLSGRARLAGFPGLVRHVPELPLVGGLALSRRTVVTDVGLLGLAAAVVVAPWTALAAVPWAVRSFKDAGDRPGRPRPVRAGQLALADVVGAAALLRGSARARRPVL
ncbi:MAG: glycosyl transferase, family 2 [Frankiales bacterium]|nr:glycosyl transferase, family 2 [Frankiales bacterium]